MAKKTKKKVTDWEKEDNRFVAFIDILGFKDSVLRESHSNIYNKLVDLSDFLESFESSLVKLEKQIFEDSEIKTFNFSDSIIVFSKNSSEGNFYVFMHSLISLFYKAMEINIPLKQGLHMEKSQLTKKKKYILVNH